MTRSVPHSIAAEESLLGAMLLSRAACETAAAGVSAGDFYKPSHGMIFEAMVRLYEHGQPIDPVTVAEELRQHDLLDAIDGPERLMALLAATPATSSAPRYVKIISDHSVLRKVIMAADEIAAAAYDLPDDVTSVVELAHVRLAEALAGIGTSEPEDLWVLDDFLDRPMEDRPQWVIPGMLRKGWRCMVVAGEGSGKTVLFRQSGIAAAQGIHPLHFQPIPHIRVLIVDLENPEDSIHDVCQPIRVQAQTVVGDAYDGERAYLWHRPAGIDLRSRRDRMEFEAVIAACRPDLVCLGPIYKAYSVSGNENDEQAAKEVMQCFDDLRTRYNFALLLEHHAPKGSGGKNRDLLPYGSSLWLRWPELGIKLSPLDSEGHTMKVGRWRGDRLENAWPVEIHRGKPWPWVGVWPDGTFNDPNGRPVTTKSSAPPLVEGDPLALPPGLDPETGEWQSDYGYGAGAANEPWEEDPPY